VTLTPGREEDAHPAASRTPDGAPGRAAADPPTDRLTDGTVAGVGPLAAAGATARRSP
jgi:hypothetical protein